MQFGYPVDVDINPSHFGPSTAPLELIEIIFTLFVHK